MALHGGCACAAVRYVLSREELPKVYCCHCRDCQSRASGAFLETAVIGPNELDVSGPLIRKENRLPSGTPFVFQACGDCLCPIITVSSNVPDKVLLKAGTLDDSDAIVPVAHIWTSRKQLWIELPDGVPQWEEAPSPEFFALVGLV